MSVVSVRARSFILALFIRDDGERFLLGDNGYDFKDSQLHFTANTIENDEVVKQGADGVMLAGQVRRSSVQSFDGYIGDGTTLKETIEEMRRDFIAFFAKGHHFRVIYIDTARNAWQRKGGYLVDAPEVKELYQIHPDYHVGLNFEDVNYYSYDEDADGNEILANLIDVPVSTEAAGGLVWDEYGAVSDDATVEYDTETATATPAKSVHITDATDAVLASFRLDGETSQNGTPTPSAPVAVSTTTGENVVEICGKNLYEKNRDSIGGYLDSSGAFVSAGNWHASGYIGVEAGEQYTLSGITTPGQAPKGCYYNSARQFVSSFNNGNQTLTIPSGVCYVRLSIFNGVGGDNVPRYDSNTLQLELGSTATAYESYQGQSYEVNLGKNLFDKDNANVLNAYFESSTPTLTSNALNRTLYIPCAASSTYTIQAVGSNWTRQVGYTSTTPAAGVSVSGIINLSANATSVSITTGSSAQYLVFRFWHQNNSAETYQQALDSIQIEKGSTATDFAPYFTPIELCKIGTYQDYIYKSGDKWYKHKAIAHNAKDVAIAGIAADNTSGAATASAEGAFLMFSGDWGSDYATTAGVARLSANVGTYKLDANITGNTGARAMESGTFCQRQGTNDRVYFRNTGLIGKTGNEVKALLAETGGIDFWYPLATTTDTEITNSSLIAQLNALLTTARTYAGINNIFTITPNEQGTLEISYYTKYQPVIIGGGYVWEAGGAGGATTVINNSIGNVNPVWTVYGPTNNPVLENTTTGEQIEYVGLIADGQTLTIDMGEQTASLDGLNVISNVIGDYISLAPGANTLIYSVSGDAGASELGWSEIVG